MNIVFYSDVNYEYQIRYLIQSIDLHNFEGLRFIYYTIGFDSDLERPDLLKKRIEIDPKKPRFEFYKPMVVHDVAKNFPGHSIFLDSDVLVGKRFDPFSLAHDEDFPLMSIGNWDMPIGFVLRDLSQPFPVFRLDDRVALKGYKETGNICEIDFDGETYSIQNEKGTFLNIKQTDFEPQIIIDYTRIMEYYRIPERTMLYVSSCFMSFNSKCEDFLLEWKSWVENEYLLARKDFYFPFQDETAINNLLWSRRVEKNLGRIFINTLDSKSLKEVESHDDIYGTNLFDDPNRFCSDSSKVQFYHGIKDPKEIALALFYLSDLQDTSIKKP